ncbi:Arc family DNA-binding protein [Serratia sp. IR-2025]
MDDMETQFHLRLPKDVHSKVKLRAKMNGRSLNAEITFIIEESLSQPAKVIGFRDEVEKEAELLSQEVKKVVFEKVVAHYRKEKTRS